MIIYYKKGILFTLNAKFYRFLLEDDKLFILLDPDYNDLTHAKILLATKMSNVRAKIDFTDPKKLSIQIFKAGSGKPGDSENEEKTLFFEDHMIALYTKNMIEENCKSAIERQMSMIETFLDSCEPHVFK